MCEFEKSILKAFEESGMNQVEFASKSGVSQGLISLFTEADPVKRRTITLPVAERLCVALGLKLVQTVKFKKEGTKMNERFRENCNIERARKLCQEPIQKRRGKMVCEQILKELDSGFIKQSTKDWLSKWVNPARKEPKVMDTFREISVELFGRKISRSAGV
jgi:hypothetical protein